MQAAWTAGITSVERAPGDATLRAVRTAAHDGFDRTVFEFDGAQVPAYHVEYIDRPVRQCGSGHVVSLPGEGWLEVRFAYARAHTDAGASTLTERALSPELPVLRALTLTCDFEGMVTWVLGLVAPNRYRVAELSDPARLVVELCLPVCPTFRLTGRETASPPDPPAHGSLAPARRDRGTGALPRLPRPPPAEALMYVGHAGAALLARGLAPRLPLLLLLVAAFGVDLVEVALKLAGQGQWVPQPAESLPVGVGLAAGFAVIGALWTRSAAGALVLGAVALSHTAADLVTGTLPLWIGGPEVGLDLFQRPVLDFVVEMALVLGGWLAYRRTLPPLARPSWAAWAMPVGLGILQIVFYVW